MIGAVRTRIYCKPMPGAAETRECRVYARRQPGSTRVRRARCKPTRLAATGKRSLVRSIDRRSEGEPSWTTGRRRWICAAPFQRLFSATSGFRPRLLRAGLPSGRTHLQEMPRTSNLRADTQPSALCRRQSRSAWRHRPWRDGGRGETIRTRTRHRRLGDAVARLPRAWRLNFDEDESAMGRPFQTTTYCQPPAWAL